ncbi:MAG: CopG family transcriptional regulator [Candidatus Competibacteraceae bacterium]|nr:MAG: CopG family transcriptional regulator [Candidatus Competibacteraceae bacterium]
MKTSEFDQKFEAGEDIASLLDLTQARRPALEPKRVNIDFPLWMVHSIDREARKLGVTRQSLIKMWLADRLQTR